MPLGCWWKFGKFWDSGVWVGNFCPHHQNWTPYPILPSVIALAFDSKLDIKLLQTFALVWSFESWILVVLSWAHKILSSRQSNFCSNWVFRHTCSACENKIMDVYLMKAQFFQMTRPACSSLDGFGVSSSGSDLPPPPPRKMVEAFMAAQKGMLCQIFQT
jgi:hypothetical protein